MTIKVWENSGESSSYVEAIFNRLVLNLPVLTGVSVSDLEVDTFFGRSRDALMSITDTKYFPETVSCSCDILDDLNKNDKNVPITERKKLSLRSIALVLRLLADLAELNWLSKEPETPRSLKRPGQANSLTSVSGIGSASHRLYYYTQTPDPLPVELAKRAFVLIARLKSSKEIMSELLEIQHKSLKEKTVHHKVLIENIDANCLSIIRFLSAANPAESLSFMQSSLVLTFSATSEESDYIPYIDLLAHIQVLDVWLVKYLEIILQGLDKIRKVIHIQMILHFSSQSIRFWLMSNPENFLNNINKESSLPLLANLLFDKCCARMPDFLTARATSVFACLLMMLTPKTFKDYMNKFDAVPLNHKHLSTSPKQLEFLKSIVKQVTTKGPLVAEYTSCMVTIMFLAGSVKKYEPDSALFRFSLLYTDAVFETLSMGDPSRYCVGLDPNVIDDLRVEFIVASTTLLVQKYTQKYSEMLKDPNLSLPTLRILTAGLKALSTNPSSREMFTETLKHCAVDLREHLLKSCEILKSSDFEQASSPSTPTVDRSRDDSLGLSLTLSKSSSTSDTSSSTKTTSQTPLSEKSSLSSPVARSSKKEPLSSFRISRHRIDMKKHMPFKISSSPSTPTLSASTSSSSQNQLQHSHSTGQKPNHYITVDLAEVLPEYYRDVAKNLFAIFRDEPIAYLLPLGFEVERLKEDFADEKKSNELTAELEQVISPFVYLYADDNAEMVEALTQFTFGIVEKLASATTTELAILYYQSCFILLKCLTALVSEHMLDVTKTNRLFGMLVLFMESRHKALEALKVSGVQFISNFHDSNSCKVAFMSLEKAIMAGFLIPDLDVLRLLKRGIKLLLMDTFSRHQTECFEDMNVEFYRAVADDNSTITSMTAYERKIKRLFFDKAHATTGLAVLWLELYDKWFLEKSDEKATHLGYIVSMAGVFISSDNEDDNLRQDVIEKIKYIICFQMDLLSLDDFKVREAAKEILSTEMSPASYKYVVRLMRKKTDEIMSKMIPTDKDLLLIDQFSLISRQIILADELYVYLLMVELITLFMDWCRIIDLAQDEAMNLKLKLRHAKLGQYVDAYKDKYSNWGLLKMRNYFARIYLDWTESALFRTPEAQPNKVISVGSDTGKSVKSFNPKKAKEMDMLAFDVGVECSSVLATLLEKNPLETPQAIHAKEFKRSRKMIFGNYFSVLYRILDKYNSSGSLDELPLSVKHKITALVENAVTGLINLLDSNVDVGFEFALPLNFHKDRRIKLSFLKVFATIVDRLKIDDDGSTQKIEAIQRTIHTVMGNPKLTLAVTSVCPASDVDSLALTFLNGDDDQLKVLKVLSTLVKLEIKTAKNSSEILRSNSVATRMLALFCKKEGFNYLERALKPTLSKIADLHDNFEVEKLSVDDPLAEENVDKFMHYLNEIVNLLFVSIDYIPNELKYLCSVIYEETGKVFPDAKIYAVGAFMFLRLIAPAIVSPEANDIISMNTDRALKRSFIQLAKVLQLMANSSITSIRWPLLLSRMNELTIMNVQITRFLQAVSKFHPKQDIIRRENNSTQVDTTFFHHLIYDHLAKIRTNFMTGEAISLQEKKDVYSSFDESLCTAGQPHSLFGYSLKPFQDGKKDQDSSLYEFMTKTSMKELNFTVRDNIAHETISADGIPSVVLNYPCLEHSSFEDAELVMFRFYQVASKIWDSKFYLVIDCTRFVSQKDFLKHLFAIFKAYTPLSLMKNLSRIYFYNICQKFLPEFIESMKYMQDDGYKDNFYFASSFDGGNFGFGLSLQTTTMNEDVRVTFNDVSLYEPLQKRFVPVTLRVGDEYLQIGSKQPFRFKAFGTMKTLTVTDIYPIGDLTGAEISSITGVPDEICVTNSADGSKLIMTSPKKIEIIRTIYFSKSRYTANLKKQREDEEDEGHDLNTWFGELINIDFVGLLSRDEDVRRASYVLLCSIGKSFQLNLGTFIDSSSEVCFPQNNISFVISNAKVLAEKHTEYTYEIVNGFFNAFKHCEEYQFISAIMYISPFIKYLFSALDNELESRREEKTSSLIKKFIEVSTIHEGTLIAFHAYIWTQLSLQDKVADILIDEAVAASIDREAEGKRWDDIISLVTMTPTLKICSSVIKRLKELSNIAKLNSEDSIATHTSWIEITVLVKVSVALFFDSPLFTEMFMSDILYITTIFMDVGPLELRTSLYKMLLNVFHSALLREDIDPENNKKALLIVNKFKAQRIKMLFGLNRDGNRKSLIESEGEIFNRISALEILCDALFDFINLVGDEEIVNVWRSRWHGLVVEAAFKQNSMLQDRAFLILGFLSKHGVTDMLIDKILHALVYFAENLVDKKTFNSVICSICALSRAVQGIPPKSPYSEKFYWLAMALNYNNNILFGHAAIQLLGNALVSVDKRGKFINGEVVNGIFETRPIFGSSMDDYEKRYGIRVTKENIDLILLCIFIRDIKAPFTKAVAMDSLENSFIVRVNNALLREKITGTHSDGHCLIYAVILFVASSSNTAFMEVVSRTNLDTSVVTDISEGIKVPTRMIEFLLSATDQAILTLLKTARYICSDASDEKSQIRFLVLYRYLSEKSPRIKWLIYPQIRPALRGLARTMSSSLLLTLVFGISKSAIVCPEYNNVPLYVKQIEDLVDQYHLRGVEDMNFLTQHPFQMETQKGIPTDITREGIKEVVEITKKIISAVAPQE